MKDPKEHFSKDATIQQLLKIRNGSGSDWSLMQDSTGAVATGLFDLD
jgi:hypothetical protein